MRGTQFEGLPRTEALVKHKAYERHKNRVQNIKPNYVADDTVLAAEDLINNFQTKKKLRSTFRNKSLDGEIQAAHQRLLGRFVEIDQGK